MGFGVGDRFGGLRVTEELTPQMVDHAIGKWVGGGARAI